MSPRDPAVSFVETMRGTLTAIEGPSTPFALEVVASAASLHDFRQNGWLELRGVVRAPYWADETPTQGSLRITARVLVYQARFRTTSGTWLTLEGIKRPSPLSPLRSMTHMTAEVRDASARVLARGSMRFDPSELAPFLLSWIGWLPTARHARDELDARRRASERRVLDRRAS